MTLSVLAAAAFGASELVPETLPDGHWFSGIAPQWTVYGMACALLLAAGVLGARKQQRYVGMQGQLRAAEQDRANMQRDLDEWQLASSRVMERLCESFGAAMLSTHEERVSIYRPASGDGSFVRLARHAKNPRFQTSGRTKYPPDEGIVGEAWQRTKATRALSRHQCRTERQWVNAMAEVSGIPKKTLRAMVMKSKTLIAQRIEDAAVHEPCAVLVYESTRELESLDAIFAAHGRGSTEAAFDSIFGDNLGVALSEAVSIMSRLRTQVDPDVATEEGF